MYPYAVYPEVDYSVYKKPYRDPTFRHSILEFSSVVRVAIIPSKFLPSMTDELSNML